LSAKTLRAKTLLASIRCKMPRKTHILC